VICVCGQLFFTPVPYVEHYTACPIVERGTGQPADFEADETRTVGDA